MPETVTGRIVRVHEGNCPVRLTIGEEVIGHLISPDFSGIPAGRYTLTGPIPEPEPEVERVKLIIQVCTHARYRFACPKCEWRSRSEYDTSKVRWPKCPDCGVLFEEVHNA